jgi:hypothetical protein
MKYVTSKFAAFHSMPKYTHNIIAMQSLKNGFLKKYLFHMILKFPIA